MSTTNYLFGLSEQKIPSYQKLQGMLQQCNKDQISQFLHQRDIYTLVQNYGFNPPSDAAKLENEMHAYPEELQHEIFRILCAQFGLKIKSALTDRRNEERYQPNNQVNVVKCKLCYNDGIKIATVLDFATLKQVASAKFAELVNCEFSFHYLAGAEQVWLMNEQDFQKMQQNQLKLTTSVWKIFITLAPQQLQDPANADDQDKESVAINQPVYIAPVQGMPGIILDQLSDEQLLDNGVAKSKFEVVAESLVQGGDNNDELAISIDIIGDEVLPEEPVRLDPSKSEVPFVEQKNPYIVNPVPIPVPEIQAQNTQVQVDELCDGYQEVSMPPQSQQYPSGVQAPQPDCSEMQFDFNPSESAKQEAPQHDLEDYKFDSSSDFSYLQSDIKDYQSQNTDIRKVDTFSQQTGAQPQFSNINSVQALEISNLTAVIVTLKLENERHVCELESTKAQNNELAAKLSACQRDLASVGLLKMEADRQIQALEEQLAQMKLSQSRVEAPKQIRCYKCDGLGQNKRGKKCKPCAGGGILSSQFHVDLQSQIKDLIDKQMPTAFLKVRDVMTSQVVDESDEGEFELDYDPTAELKRQQAEEARRLLNLQPVGMERRTNQQVNLSAVCESESFTENYTVLAGQQVRKTWTFKNGGGQKIPKGTRLIYADGHNLGFSVPSVQAEVKVGDCFEMEVQFSAPTECDHFSSGFSLESPDKRLFGEKVWCGIIVEDEQSDAMRVSQLMDFTSIQPQKNLQHPQPYSSQIPQQHQFNQVQHPKPSLQLQQPLPQQPNSTQNLNQVPLLSLPLPIQEDNWGLPPLPAPRQQVQESFSSDLSWAMPSPCAPQPAQSTQAQSSNNYASGQQQKPAQSQPVQCQPQGWGQPIPPVQSPHQQAQNWGQAMPPVQSPQQKPVQQQAQNWGQAMPPVQSPQQKPAQNWGQAMPPVQSPQQQPAQQQAQNWGQLPPIAPPNQPAQQQVQPQSQQSWGAQVPAPYQIQPQLQEAKAVQGQNVMPQDQFQPMPQRKNDPRAGSVAVSKSQVDYFTRVDKELEGVEKQTMLKLLEFDCLDYDLNLKASRECKYNLDSIMDKILGIE